MAGNFDNIQFHNLEKAISNDFNGAQLYPSKDIQNILKDLFNKPPTILGENTTAVGGVFGNGLEVQPMETPSLQVVVSPGRGFYKEGTATETESDYRYFELYPPPIDPAVSVNFTGLLPASGMARVDLIQIKYATDDASNKYGLRHFWEVLSKTWRSNNVKIRNRPAIDITAIRKAGTPFTKTVVQSDPFPTPDVGYLPLCYVYVKDTTTSITYENLIDARRVLVPTPLSGATGVIRGFALSYLSNSVFNVSPGEAFVNGHFLRNPTQAGTTSIPLSNALVVGDSIQAETVYYIYLVRPDKCVGVKVDGADKLIVATSIVPPNRSGSPSASFEVFLNADKNITETIHGYSSAPEQTELEQKAVYLGFITTNASSQIRDFFKTGKITMFGSPVEIFHNTNFIGTSYLDLTKYIPEKGFVICSVTATPGSSIVAAQAQGDFVLGYKDYGAVDRDAINAGWYKDDIYSAGGIFQGTIPHNSVSVLSTAASNGTVNLMGYIDIA